MWVLEIGRMLVLQKLIMCIGDALKSFQQLQEEFNLSQTHFYCYLQMRSYLNSIPLSTVLTEIEKFLGIKMEMDPKQCILGINPLSLSGHTAKLLSIMLYAPRLSILHVWLDVNPPTLAMWYDKLLSIVPFERLSHVLLGT